MKLQEFHDMDELEVIGDQAKSMHKDHEVQMARSELYKAAKAAMALHDMLKHLPEDANIEGWVQAKITKASDYLCSVRSYLEYEQHSTGDITVDETMGLAESLVMENLSIDQLAAVSDEALDNAYHYGRSTPGNSFGWQANLKSAEFAKKAIDSGITDIEQIADQIHKGWNVTAQAFVHDPNQFDDTAKLRDSGKLQAKLEQRAKLMKIEYAQLPEEEKEKDRVVARALLNAITGKQGMAEAGFRKTLGHTMSGWGGAEDSPRELVRRNRAYPYQSVLDLAQSISSPIKGSPQALQKRVLDRKKIPILQKKFRSNENNNYHAENAVLLAKYFGTPEDLSAAQAALNYRDEHDGYDYRDNQARRHMDAQQQIYKKYYPMLFGAKKGMAETAGAAATGSASVATSMAGNGFKNGGPGTIKRESAKRPMKGKK